VPPARKPLTVTLPRPIADEIAGVAKRTERSPAFIVRRAFAAAAQEKTQPLTAAASLVTTPSDKVILSIDTDEDDPPNTAARIREAAGKASLEDALTSAWLSTRKRFLQWAEREESAGQAERADDLDTGLREAADPSTSQDRLVELSKSEYPKIRALVAAHASTPKEALERLAGDKEPYVRDAVENRRLKG
jgi:hypothetical protein